MKRIDVRQVTKIAKSMLACVHTALAYSKGVGEREQERAQYSMLVNLSDSTTSAMDNGPTNLTAYSLRLFTFSPVILGLSR